jgi:hypothetical protein
MPARQHTKPFAVEPPEAAPKRSYRPPAPKGRRESTKPFRSEPPEALKSDIREIAQRTSYRPPASVGPTSTRPSAPPKASVSLAAFKNDEPDEKKSHLRAVPSPAPSVPPPAPPTPAARESGRDDTPSGKRAVAQVPSPPPVPREAVLAMPTTQLPLEEIDYDEAYRYDADALEARLKRKSLIPEPIVAVATDVRQSLTPTGRNEAKKELRDMRRVSMSGFARLLRKAADFLDAYA